MKLFFVGGRRRNSICEISDESGEIFRIGGTLINKIAIIIDKCLKIVGLSIFVGFEFWLHVPILNN